MEYTDEYSFARPYLSNGETILWKGRPGKGHLLTGNDIFLIPFSIAWSSGALTAVFSSFSSGMPLFLYPIMLLFAGAAFYILIGRFIWTAYVRKNTAYVITNRRIIRSRRGKVDSLSARSMPSMRAKVRKDGTGTIRFGEPSYYRRNTFDPNDGLFTLENIPDVIRVQQIIETMER